MKVSAIVTVYNVSAYLEKCLNSVIKLGDKVSEIICINDGSSDNSEDIILQYMLKDKRVQLINQKNRGVSSARNVGINNATGDYLIFIDGDDYIFPEELEKLLDEIAMNNFPDGVWTGYSREDWNGLHSEITNLSGGIWEKTRINQKFIPAILGISYKKLYAWLRKEQKLNQKQEFPTIWRGLYSKRVINQHSIFFNTSVSTGEDILFNYLFYSYAQNLYVSNYNYYCYVWRKGSLTQNTNLQFYEARKKLVFERDLQNAQLIEDGKPDFSPEYQGSLVMTKFQMALILSKCRLTEVIQNYKLYKKYVNSVSIESAYRNFSLKEIPLKYKIIFGIAKMNWNSILFAGSFFLNQLNIHIYPDE